MLNNFSFENQGANTYLVYAVQPEDALDSVGLGMLTNNQIPGFAKTIFSQMDAQKYIKYNISSRVTLKQAFSGTVSRHRLVGAFSGILDAVMSTDDYMLDASAILLDMEYIYIDISNDSTVLIYLPVSGTGDAPELGQFFKGIMFNTQFDPNENCDYVAKIINYLNSTPNIVPADFKKMLAETEQAPQRAPVTARAPAAQQAPAASRQPTPAGAPQAVQANPRPVAAAPAPAGPAAPQTPVRPVQTPARPVQAPARPVQAPARPAQPPQIAVPEQPRAAAAAEASEEKMSMLYLLRHYSKENAEIYKAQQKKNKEETKGEAPAKKAKADKQKKAQRSPVSDPGFAMPGQPTPQPAAPQPAAPQPAARQVVTPQPATPQPAARQVATPQPAVRQPAAPQPAPQPAPQAQSGARNYGTAAVSYAQPDEETSFLDAGDETVIMGQENTSQRLIPHLLRRKNNERIPIEKEVFRLGRDVEFNDYAVIDNRFVGHSHCHIVSRDGEYFVVDDNSKNHTKVNGTQITPGTEVKLAHDYVISVADEEFEFKLF